MQTVEGTTETIRLEFTSCQINERERSALILVMPINVLNEDLLGQRFCSLLHSHCKFAI